MLLNFSWTVFREILCCVKTQVHKFFSSNCICSKSDWQLAQVSSKYHIKQGLNLLFEASCCSVRKTSCHKLKGFLCLVSWAKWTDLRVWGSEGQAEILYQLQCFATLKVLLCNPIKVWPGWVCRAPQGTPLVVPGRRPGCWQLLLSGSLYQASVTSHLLHLWHRQKAMNVILMWGIHFFWRFEHLKCHRVPLYLRQGRLYTWYLLSSKLTPKQHRWINTQVIRKICIFDLRLTVSLIS